jgi:hypothetical protein
MLLKTNEVTDVTRTFESKNLFYSPPHLDFQLLSLRHIKYENIKMIENPGLFSEPGLKITAKNTLSKQLFYLPTITFKTRKSRRNLLATNSPNIGCPLNDGS